MKGSIFILNIESDKIHLSSTKRLSISESNIPKLYHNFKHAAVWTVKVLNYFRDEQRLAMQILSYETGKQDFPLHQQNQSDIEKIATISFRSIDTIALLNSHNGTCNLVSAQPVKNNTPEKEYTPYRYYDTPIQTEPKIQRKNIKETFYVSLDDIHFGNKEVSFFEKISDIDYPIEFKVSNDFILQEFDAIKNYIGKALNVKKVKVEVEITLEGNIIENIKTSSTDILKIDQSIIEKLRLNLLSESFKRVKLIETDKSILSLEDFIEKVTNKKISSKLFYDDEFQLLDDMLKISNTKHYKHLKFLSNKHAVSKLKLKFLFKPFSFIFLVEGENNYYFIWETLNTKEATYIWIENKNTSELYASLNKIEDAMRIIKTNGKNNYINSVGENFKRIYHDYSDPNDGFLKWKEDFEKLIT